MSCRPGSLKWVLREQQRWDGLINGQLHDHVTESICTVHCPRRTSVGRYKTIVGYQGLSLLPFSHKCLLTLSSKKSTTKIVSSPLDSQPRWLRPRNREEMEQRIAGLSESQANGKAKRDCSRAGKNEHNLAPVLHLCHQWNSARHLSMTY
jgi:hypothetical protein